MSFKKTHDLKVAYGTYQKDGETKKSYRTVGAVMEDPENGNKFLFIDPTFNFAAVKREDGRDSVIVSMFEPKAKEDQATTAKEESV